MMDVLHILFDLHFTYSISNLTEHNKITFKKMFKVLKKLYEHRYQASAVPSH